MEKNTPVKIYRGEDRKYLGIGYYVSSSKSGIPNFKINGRYIGGWQCWWIELAKAKCIEKELKDEVSRTSN